VLPNGLSSAPRIFTKLLKPVFAYLRTLGYISSGYIDDSFLMGHDLRSCADNVTVTFKFLTDLGFFINSKKSVMVPTRELEHLGFFLNSVNMTVKLPPSKCHKLVSTCITVLNGESPITIRKVAELIGLMVSSFPGVQMGPLFYRTLDNDKKVALQGAAGNFDTLMTPSFGGQQEIRWWIDNVHSAKRDIDHGKFNFCLTTDASQEGWGAVFSCLPHNTDTRSTEGRWTVDEKVDHINVLELTAGFLGLKAFCAQLTRKAHIQLFMDNTTAISYINHMGGSHSTACNGLAKQIWLWCQERNIWLTAVHIPGRLNVIADARSRQFDDKTEWKLDTEVFNILSDCFVKPDIDLFASRLNYQLKPYASWLPDPEAYCIDAFTIDWSRHIFYAFPPFSIINRVLQKIELDQATGILVVPDWPTQSWYPMVWRLALQPPRPLTWHRDLVVLPYKTGVHPMGHKLKLMACYLSGAH